MSRGGFVRILVAAADDSFTQEGDRLIDTERVAAAKKTCHDS